MRARLLILASAVAMLGWGTVLPYQYAYAATTRGWGSLVAAAASSLFSVGALLAAPVGGRLADRMSPVTVAVAAKVVAAAGAASLIWANGPVSFLVGMFVFGLGITAAGPAQSVLVLRWVGGADRRRVFAWQFTGQALGMAVGAFAAGYVVDLDRADGMWPAFAAAAVGLPRVRCPPARRRRPPLGYAGRLGRGRRASPPRASGPPARARRCAPSGRSRPCAGPR